MKPQIFDVLLLKTCWLFVSLLSLIALSACSTSSFIDEYRTTETQLALNTGEKIVIMGRRHAGEYETEPDFIDCIGNRVSSGGVIPVMQEQEFLDRFYPWFEPRTAPLKLKRMNSMLQQPLVASQINALGIRYMVWVDGNTETTDKNGAFSCAIGPGGGGCFGFASWDNTSNYEAIIWDLKPLSEQGRVKIEAKGSSYLLAIGAPIPFIAQVKSEACEGIGKRLKSFFLQSENNSVPTAGSTSQHRSKQKSTKPYRTGPQSPRQQSTTQSSR